MGDAQSPETGLKEIIIVASIISLVVGIFIVLFIQFYQRKQIQHQLDLQLMKQHEEEEKTKSSVRSQEDERKRISGDLHDEMGINISTVRLYLKRVAKKSQGDTEVQQTLDEIDGILNQSFESARRITHNLSPLTIYKFGLQAGIKQVCEQLNNTNMVACDYQPQDVFPRFAPHRELAVYRIVQELVNNVLKHSNAQNFFIEMHHTENQIEVIVQDDGSMADAGIVIERTIAQKGIGLFNIESRLSMLGAAMTINTMGNGIRPGHEVKLVVPINTPEDMNPTETVSV